MPPFSQQFMRCGGKRVWVELHAGFNAQHPGYCVSRIGSLHSSRWISQEASRPANADWDEETNAEFERQSKIKETRYRWFKKVFSTALFGSTLGLVYYAKKRRQAELSENLRDCVRLPIDENYHGGHQEFYRVPSLASPSVSYVFPSQMVKNGSIRRLKTLPVRPGDVIVASFPKAGTTWIQEIVWLIKHNLDFQKASESVLESRFPYLEYGVFSVENLESPRLMKTHVPFDFLPADATTTGKVIYVKRNPKDTVVSYYHFSRMFALSSYRGTFEEYLDMFKKDRVPYGPYFDHIDSYMDKQEDPNLLIISYEEISKDPAEIIRRIGAFLDKPLTEDEIQAIVRHTTFESMSKNRSVNYSHWDEIGFRNQNEAQFYRKGKVGNWKNYFTEETNANFDAWIQEKNKGQRFFEYDLQEVVQ